MSLKVKQSLMPSVPIHGAACRRKFATPWSAPIWNWPLPASRKEH